MNNIKRKLKQRTKLTEYFYKNGQIKFNHEKILEKSVECPRNIIEVKKNFILNMTSKLADSHTAPKSYWTLLNNLLCNVKIPAIPPSLVEEPDIFNNFFASIYTPIKMQTPCHPICIEVL